ncbi:MAG TPA: nitroreductase family protein [Candidatus Aphodoplasma excrementigallinarum]|uniref:Nitroreductase family protein n=1 Tax=Candidatus Aphodoplasma excrementigallinarum TaxID=2840673 RepID=A0A9D1NID5_9FIRM|nr:nitroreductase family protein [Candidatus Aphodoplasma excrementigallinarum]
MLKDLVIKNRSYRGYDPSRKVTREELAGFVDCARLSPSSVNAQPLKYYLASSEEDTAKLQPLTKWAAALPDITLPHPGKCPPAFIVICQDTAISDAPTRFLRDVGIAAQTILLAATEAGLGGCMIGNFNARAVSEALQLNDTLRPMLLVAIGKPDETVVLTEAAAGGSVQYYRDENDVHYVPKRRLEDILL